jgi:hypothetical protein
VDRGRKEDVDRGRKENVDIGRKDVVNGKVVWIRSHKKEGCDLVSAHNRPSTNWLVIQ